MAQDIHLSRRDALKAAGGSLVLSGLAAGTAQASRGKTEIEQYNALVGTRYSVGEHGAVYRLEEVVALSPRVRPEGAFSNRAPFALVFKHESGDSVKCGCHDFSRGIGTGTALLATHYVANDGEDRLEAIFN